MKALLNRIHARVGDLWWYSAMIFLACRSGDAIQAFIGLWLVPKYVGPQELGAVLPLQQLTSFLTVPLAIVAVVFSKYVNTYATRGEYGKVKSFIHDVFTCSFILFIVCIAGAYLVMPFFYERLKIASGSLTFLILICGLFGNIGSIVGSAQQGLKRFKTMSAMALISAPIRLVTLLIAMPIRALSGYILGQTTPVATTSLLSIFDIRKALKPYSLDKSWRKDWIPILKYALPICIITIFNIAGSTLSTTIYRQRLPAIESSAFYVLSRFSDLACFFGASLSVVLFPLAAEAHEKRKESSKLLYKTILGISLSTLALSICTALLGPMILSLNDTWRPYREFAHLLPWMTVATGIGTATGSIQTFDLACKRTSLPYFFALLNLLWAVFLMLSTGITGLRGVIPESAISAVSSLNIANLATLTYISVFWGLIQLIIGILLIVHRNQK